MSSVADEPALLRRYRAEVFVATWLSYFGFYLVRKTYAVVKGPLKIRLGLDDVHVAYPWTIYLVAYMVGQFFAAWLGRHVQSRRALIYGMVVAAASNVVLGYLVDGHRASAYLWICVTMAIHGVAQAVGWPHNVGLFANWTRRAERGTLFGIWGTCYQIGAVAGKGLAAFLLGWLGIAWSFIGSSLVLLVITAVFAALARERPEAVGLSLHDESEAPAPGGADAGRRQEPLPHGWVGMIVAMGLIYFGLKFLRYALDSWSALILSEQFRLSATRAGYLSAAFDLIGFLGVITAGIWSDRIAGAFRTPVIFWMILTCLAATCLMWFAGLTSATLFVVLLGVIGFTAMGPDSLVSGVCAMDAGSRRQAALAAGIINGLGSIGPIVQEPAIGWLKQTSGVDAVFLLLVAVVALTTLGTGLLWFVQRRQRAPKSGDAR
ncbi:MAG: MFS transporter [Proteobacteria bacterium]|nr:MFS transporter [Pseudomonadota bacterium]